MQIDLAIRPNDQARVEIGDVDFADAHLQRFRAQFELMQPEVLPFHQILFVVFFDTGEVVELYSALVIRLCWTGAAGN